MKLLYITNGISGSAGLERVLSIKTKYLADQFDYEIHILVLNHNDAAIFYEFSPKVILHDIKVFGSSFQYLKQYIYGIRQVIKKVQPDIILVCDDGLKGFFLPIINPISCKTIYERHVSKNVELISNGSLISKIKVSLKFSLMNQLAKKFNRFVVLTNDNKTEWKTNNMVVISNPLSFYPQEKALLCNKKIIAVGRHNYQKGFDLLLQAWKIINKKHSDWHLEIYGKKDSNLALDLLANKLDINKTVHFYDPVKNIEQKYLEASIYALSSRFEGFGMVLIEAMACGLPCVSFDCPCGPKDIITDNQDGFLVNNGDVQMFAKKIMILIENQELRKNLGNSAKNNVTRFLPEKIASQWHNLFIEITSN